MWGKWKAHIHYNAHYVQTSQNLSTHPHTCSSENPLHACVTIQMPSWAPEELAAKSNLTGNSICGAILGPIYTKTHPDLVCQTRVKAWAITFPFHLSPFPASAGAFLTRPNRQAAQSENKQPFGRENWHRGKSRGRVGMGLKNSLTQNKVLVHMK